MRRRHLNKYWLNVNFLQYIEVGRETQRYHFLGYPLQGFTWRLTKNQHGLPYKVLFIRIHHGMETAFQDLQPFTRLILLASDV